MIFFFLRSGECCVRFISVRFTYSCVYPCRFCACFFFFFFCRMWMVHCVTPSRQCNHQHSEGGVRIVQEMSIPNSKNEWSSPCKVRIRVVFKMQPVSISLSKDWHFIPEIKRIVHWRLVQFVIYVSDFFQWKYGGSTGWIKPRMPRSRQSPLRWQFPWHCGWWC